MINNQVASARDVYSDGERRFKRHGMDDNPRPYQIRYSHTQTRTNGKTRCNASCPTIINECTLLRSRDIKASTMTHRNHEVELAPWQKLRKKFSREYVKHIEENKRNLQMSSGEMTNCLAGKQRNFAQSDIEIPTTVVFPPPDQRTASDSFNGTNIYRQCPNVGSNFEKLTDIKKPTNQHTFKGYTVINEEGHRKVNNWRNEEIDLQDMTSMSTIEENAEDNYTKYFNTKPHESDVDSDCGDNDGIKLEERKSSKINPSVEDTHHQQRRERKPKKMKSHRCSENISSDSDSVITEKGKRYSKSCENHSSDSEKIVIEKRKKNSDKHVVNSDKPQDETHLSQHLDSCGSTQRGMASSARQDKSSLSSQKKHVITKTDEEPSITEVNIDAESDKYPSNAKRAFDDEALSIEPNKNIKCNNNPCSDQEKMIENKKLHKLTRSKTQILAINGYEDYCFGKTPTTSVSKLLYEHCIKRTTASNMVMVFPFVIFCSILLWIVDSLYYYIQFGDPPEEKFWYDFRITYWFKLLHGTTVKYLESIVLPVPVK